MHMVEATPERVSDFSTVGWGCWLWLTGVNRKSLLPDLTAGLTSLQRKRSNLQLYTKLSVAMALRQHYVHWNSALKGVA